MTVLLVDDETDVSKYYQKALEHQGCLVIFCSSVEEALVAAKDKYQFKAIIIDMMLPWGCYSDPETGGGLHTGLPLYLDISKYHPNARYIVLTNLHLNQIPPEFCNPKIKICNKGDYPPLEFAKFVADIGKES